MKRSEFSAQRVLVLGSKSHGVMLLRSILGAMGVGKVVHVEHRRRALELLGMEHFSAVFCEPTEEELGERPFVVAARRKDGMVNPMIPIFMLKEQARRKDVERARDAGVNDVLTMPMSPRSVMTKLRTAIHSPRAFIVGADFFGPDRRAKVRATYHGIDRRKRMPKKTKIEFTQL